MRGSVGFTAFEVLLFPDLGSTMSQQVPDLRGPGLKDQVSNDKVIGFGVAFQTILW